jgi:transcriptional regulator with XRE-family HTH domain
MAEPYLHVTELARLLSRAREEKRLSYKLLGQASDVDQAQAYRICNGRFKRLDQSVLQICRTLEVDPPGKQLPELPSEPSAQLMTRELMAAWDRTPAGANRLAQILRAMRQYRES